MVYKCVLDDHSCKVLQDFFPLKSCIFSDTAWDVKESLWDPSLAACWDYDRITMFQKMGLNKIKDDIERWNNVAMSLQGRATAVKMNVLPIDRPKAVKT